MGMSLVEKNDNVLHMDELQKSQDMDKPIEVQSYSSSGDEKELDFVERGE